MVAVENWLDCRLPKRGLRATPSELMGRCSPVTGGGGASGHSGVEWRWSFGDRGDCLTCGEAVTAGEMPSCLSSSSPIGVSGPPISRLRGCGGRGMSEIVDTGCGACGVCAGAVVPFFFLPILKKPRFSLVAGEEGACLLSRSDPAAKAVPCGAGAPLVCPLVTVAIGAADVDGLVTSISSSRSVESPSSSPALRGMPRTGAKPGGNSYASGSESESANRLAKRLGRSSSSSLESANRLLKALDLAGAGVGDFAFGLGIDLGLGKAGTGGTSLGFLRNRPAGDKDLMLNLDDFTGSGEDGRIDGRKLD